MCLFDVCSRVVVFATGVIKDPVEFAIFAYVDTWGGGGDVTVLATCTHGRCSATHGAGGGVMLPFWQLAHMVGVPQHLGRVG